MLFCTIAAPSPLHQPHTRYRDVAVCTLAAVAFAWATLFSSAPARAELPVGIWLDHTQRGAIELYPCGANVCGRVIWMKNPLKPSGEPFRDRRNPDASKQNRTICGMDLIGGLQPDGRGNLLEGWIYDPERGQEFSAQIKRESDTTLVVTGYLMMPAFGKSFRWTKAPADLERCAPIVKAAEG